MRKADKMLDYLKCMLEGKSLRAVSYTHLDVYKRQAGEMSPSDIEDLKQVCPKIILLAGGVDYGEKTTAIKNAALIAGSGLASPVIYAGNVAARSEIRRIFDEAGIKTYFVDNVYPKVDELVVEPARKVIQDVFEEHIVTAPGMDRIRSMVNGPIMPVSYTHLDVYKRQVCYCHPGRGVLCDRSSCPG